MPVDDEQIKAALLDYKARFDRTVEHAARISDTVGDHAWATMLRKQSTDLEAKHKVALDQARAASVRPESIRRGSLSDDTVPLRLSAMSMEELEKAAKHLDRYAQAAMGSLHCGSENSDFRAAHAASDSGTAGADAIRAYIRSRS